MAKKQRPEQRAEHRWQHDEEERQRRVKLIQSSTPEIPKRRCTPLPTRFLKYRFMFHPLAHATNVDRWQATVTIG
jgi:hypothetical protein